MVQLNWAITSQSNAEARVPAIVSIVRKKNIGGCQRVVRMHPGVEGEVREACRLGSKLNGKVFHDNINIYSNWNILFSIVVQLKFHLSVA